MKKHLNQQHPTEEEWMEYLYQEMGSPEKRAFEAHLRDCAPCRQKDSGLRGTQQSLDEWHVDLPAKHKLSISWQPGAKWAAAAVLLVSTAFAAFATGRISRPAVDVDALQAQIARPIEQRVEQQMAAASERVLAAAEEKLRAQLAARFQEVADKALAEAAASTKKQLEELSASIAALREQDQKVLAAALDEYESQRMEEYLKFRQDLERVALFSQSVAQFASYTPDSPAEPQTEPEN